MFPSQTNQKIAKFFWNIAKIESNINNNLMELKNSLYYNPMKIFNFFDKESKGFVTIYDFLSFFK
ncbi:MAG: hypothetical protein MJ252_28825 [archaeon]|nr:hypothetical protein [archaeon]